MSSITDKLESQLTDLLVILIKCEYQTTVLKEVMPRDSVVIGWLKAIDGSRETVNKLVKNNSNLQRRAQGVIIDVYPIAKKRAMKAMKDFIPVKHRKMAKNDFPETCPWDFKQIMDTNWYPLNGVSLDD
ncbi:DUF29 domain-containing protein [Endozoicomonas sp. ONNA1]|uniref:DUF29 domain-containing protein n=1 Tax=Endozoicomonas sp. ONNA1 TaxID=2828740 RepID=UPI0021489201